MTFGRETRFSNGFHLDDVAISMALRHRVPFVGPRGSVDFGNGRVNCGERIRGGNVFRVARWDEKPRPGSACALRNVRPRRAGSRHWLSGDGLTAQTRLVNPYTRVHRYTRTYYESTERGLAYPPVRGSESRNAIRAAEPSLVSGDIKATHRDVRNERKMNLEWILRAENTERTRKISQHRKTRDPFFPKYFFNETKKRKESPLLFTPKKSSMSKYAVTVSRTLERELTATLRATETSIIFEPVSVSLTSFFSYIFYYRRSKSWGLRRPDDRAGGDRSILHRQ